MCLFTPDFSVHISSIHLAILNYVLYIIYCRFQYLHFIVFLLLLPSARFLFYFPIYIVSYKILPKFSNSNVLVLLINFLCVISSLICSHFCWKIILSFSFLCIAEMYVIQSFSSSLKGHLPLSTPFFRTLTFQTPSPSHATFIYPIQLITTRCMYVCDIRLQLWGRWALSSSEVLCSVWW